jgi:hypothetical protein
MADFAKEMSEFVDGLDSFWAAPCQFDRLSDSRMDGATMTRFISICVSVALIGVPVAASAKSASNLRDLVGARAAGAERDLQRRGFFITDGHKGANASYTYWWSPSRKDCVMVQTRDGRYASINDVSAADCNQQNHHGSSNGAAAGVAVGALIGAALLAHKSGHHDDGQHYSDTQREADYERGYRDGLHGQSESSYGRNNDTYRSGYQSGVEQRGRETAYDQPSYGGGYGRGLDLNSLVGARAAGVDSELTSNGFRTVDGFQSGANGRGTVWWNAGTRQCVQVITVGGRADSVTDIGTHPRCR